MASRAPEIAAYTSGALIFVSGCLGGVLCSSTELKVSFSALAALGLIGGGAGGTYLTMQGRKDRQEEENQRQARVISHLNPKMRLKMEARARQLGITLPQLQEAITLWKAAGQVKGQLESFVQQVCPRS